MDFRARYRAWTTPTRRSTGVMLIFELGGAVVLLIALIAKLWMHRGHWLVWSAVYLFSLYGVLVSIGDTRRQRRVLDGGDCR